MFTVEKLDLFVACERYSTEWLDIVASQKLNPSLGPQWQAITANSHDVGKACRVMIVKAAGEVVAIIPYLTKRISYHGLGMREFSLLSNLVCYHNEFVSTLPLSTTCSLIVQHEPDCDVFRLAAFFNRSGDEATSIASSIADVPNIRVIEEAGESSPYLPITESWDDLYNRQHKKFRYKIRRRLKRLEEHGNLVFQWYEDQSDTDELISTIEKIERQSWKSEAGIDIAARREELRYHQLLLPWLANTGHLVAGVLLADNKPIAYTTACCWPDWTGFTKTSFDSDFAKLEPGAIITEATIRRCIFRGTQEFDFLGSADGYKLSWTRQVREHSDLTLYNKRTIKGRTISSARRIWHALSSLVRPEKA